ncbi:MAG: cytochrome c3 family protein [Candidatus Aminicenantales bacterium]
MKSSLDSSWGGKLFDLNIPADTMAEADVDCQSCHRPAKGKISRVDSQSCLECHEENYFQEFEDRQKEIRAKMESLQTILAGLKTVSLTAEEKTALEEDKRILEEMINEGSSGAHNLSFYSSWLSGIIAKWSAYPKGKN